MTTLDAGATHDVTDQPPSLVGHDVAEGGALLEGVVREGAKLAVPELHRLGRLAGLAQAQEWGEQAKRLEPELRTHDRYGHRVDEVDSHPAWQAHIDLAVSSGLAGAAWPSGRPGAHVA